MINAGSAKLWSSPTRGSVNGSSLSVAWFGLILSGTAFRPAPFVSLGSTLARRLLTQAYEDLQLFVPELSKCGWSTGRTLAHVRVARAVRRPGSLSTQTGGKWLLERLGCQTGRRCGLRPESSSWDVGRFCRKKPGCAWMPLPVRSSQLSCLLVAKWEINTGEGARTLRRLQMRKCRRHLF